MNLSKKLSKNYILVIDEVLTKKQCELIINKYKVQTKGSVKNSYSDCLYKDDLEYYFIDQKTFEQINIKKDLVGE